MTYQSPDIQSVLQNILQFRKQQAAQQPAPQSNNQGQQNQNPLPGMQGNGFQGSSGSGSNGQSGGLQAISQFLGYAPNTTMGYNMSNSTQPNAPSQNWQQAGGIGGLLNNLFGGNLFGGQ